MLCKFRQKIFSLILFLEIFSLPFFSSAGTLSCSITTAVLCVSPAVVVLRMSAATNAHSELASQSTLGYALNAVCCTGVTNLGNSCSGTFAIAAKLSAVTNAHIEQNSNSNFTNNACLSVSPGSVTIGYQATNCTGFDTTLASMPSATNSHIGSPADYTTKICGTASASSQSLTFSISTNTVGFGNLSVSSARFATADTLGSGTETEAHQLIASTNASSGYNITVQGATLAAGANTITAIGATNTALSVGSKQFGLRMSASGGTGVVSSPYAASGFAYAADASTASTVASESVGDGVSTTYSVRYLGNISGSTPSGSYSTTLTYVATANF
jgi:hypothetical protein